MPEPDTRCPQADLVLRGGVVHPFAGPTLDAGRTLDTRLARDAGPGCDTGPAHDAGPVASALAIRDGVVMRVGTDADVQDLVGRDTRVVDLAGRAVLPGINDAHLHATWLGALWPDTLFGDGGAPQGGPSRPLRTDEERRAAILRANDLLASLGITSYTEPGLGPGEDDGPVGAFGSSVVRQYRELAAQGRLKARVTVLSLFGQLDGPSDLDSFLAGLASIDRERGLTRRESTSPSRDRGSTGQENAQVDREWADPRRLRFAGVKIFADGIPPMRSAYTHGCYADGHQASLLVAGTDDAQRERNLTRMVLAAHRAGLQVGVHATGDRSITLVLDAVAAARAERDVDLGHYVIHGDLVDGDQLRRMAELGVGLSVQAGIAVRTHAMVDAALGAGRGAAAWPIGPALDAGIPLCLTSDAPVLSPDWRQEIAAADAWLGPAADPRVRMATLLRCYTVHPARQDGAADWKGTLAPGMVADLCVLEADPLALTPAELPDVAVDLTVLGGEVVHERRVPALG